MDLPGSGVINEFIRIPKVFCSSETNKPIEHCLVCNKFLLEDGTPYMVEKAMKQHLEMNIKEAIFEYAMCMDCAVMMNASLSEESRMRIDEYFVNHVNFSERRAQLLKRKTLRTQPWISHCIITGKPISKSPEYQLVAQCDGKHLMFTYMPFALSMEAMDDITNLLSDKSLGEIDDFMGKYFTGPPEVAELLKKRFVLV